MPPNRFSRHRFETGQTDDAGRLFLDDREPFEFRDLPDNRQHVVKEGQTWWSLATIYFDGMPRPAAFWWAIADFQTPRVVDPTLAIPMGSVVIIPSLRTLQEEILNERRREEAS